MASKEWKQQNRDKLFKCRRDWYAKNKERAKNSVLDRKNKLKEFFKELKSTLYCAECGENNPVCLDFHHTNPTEKEINISQMVNHGWSKNKMLKEIDKCVVLCSNCHRKKHAGLA